MEDGGTARFLPRSPWAGTAGFHQTAPSVFILFLFWVSSPSKINCLSAFVMMGLRNLTSSDPFANQRTAMPNHPRFPPKQRGVALLEVMIAFLLLSIGLIGFSALQVRAVRATQSSLQRTDASNLAVYIMESMRANKAAAIKLGSTPYNLPAGTCSAPGGVPSTLAQNDLANWYTAVKKALGNVATTCADITCIDESSAAKGMCTVNIYWDDSRALGGSSAQSVQLVGRL